MHAHDAVAEAALIGIPDEKWGEVGCAVVVIKGGQSLDDGDLLDFLTQRLARYKVPRQVMFVDELPKTGPGKIDKKRLVQQFA